MIYVFGLLSAKIERKIEGNIGRFLFPPFLSV